MNARMINNEYLSAKGVEGYGNGLLLGISASEGLRKLTMISGLWNKV
jgi:hypothetical protein